MGRLTQAVGFITTPKKTATGAWCRSNITKIDADDKKLDKLRRQYASKKELGLIK